MGDQPRHIGWWNAIWHPDTQAGSIVCVLVSIATCILALGRFGLAAISIAVHVGAWLGDAGDGWHPLIGQVAMLVGTGAALIAILAAIVTAAFLIVGIGTALGEKLVQSSVGGGETRTL